MTLVGATPQTEVRMRRPLFQKYFLALFIAVIVPLTISGASDAWFGYRGYRAMLDQRLHIEAKAAANQISNFLNSIKKQMGWTTQLVWTESNSERHRLDALRLLRQVPAIVDITLVDGAGIERLRVSRIGRDIIGSGIDRSVNPAVTAAQTDGVWYSPVTLKQGSEPYMTMAVAGNRAAIGVTIAQINLKLIWEVISTIRIGRYGDAFIVDRNGKLVAHPNMSLVLQGRDQKTEARLKALQTTALAARGQAIRARGTDGQTVLAAMAPIGGVNWMVFAEQPLSEAFAPIRAALWRTAMLVLGGTVFAAVLALVLARRMADPIRKLEEGAAYIGAGQFDHKINIGTGDELESLGNRFNQMGGELALARDRAERITRLKRFLSPQVAELVEQSGQSDMLTGQRADVVVLFCDLRGFTTFSTKADPDEIMQVLGDYYEALGASIMRYSATLTHFSGDGLMVILNAPVRCAGDPALHGARMAREMQAEVQGLITDWSGRGHAMGFGIGLTRGTATVGRIGYEGRHDYTAIGNVVNLASRLCSSAADGQILLDANVAAGASAVVPIRPLEPRGLKGFIDPVPVYEIVN